MNRPKQPTVTTMIKIMNRVMMGPMRIMMTKQGIVRRKTKKIS